MKTAEEWVIAFRSAYGLDIQAEPILLRLFGECATEANAEGAREERERIAGWCHETAAICEARAPAGGVFYMAGVACEAHQIAEARILRLLAARVHEGVQPWDDRGAGSAPGAGIGKEEP